MNERGRILGLVAVGMEALGPKTSEPTLKENKA